MLQGRHSTPDSGCTFCVCANAGVEAGLPTGLRGRFARLRGYLPFGRSSGGLEEGVVTGNETVEGREIEHRIEEEPDERTSLLGDSR
jgi:hypothetical protein